MLSRIFSDCYTLWIHSLGYFERRVISTCESQVLHMYVCMRMDVIAEFKIPISSYFVIIIIPLHRVKYNNGVESRNADPSGRVV